MKSTDPTRSLRLTSTSKLLLTCIAVALFVSCASTVPTSKQHVPQLATPVQPLIGEAYELLLTQWRDEHGRIPADGMLRAMEQARALREAMRARPERAGITPANWSWLGPGNIGGRVTSLVFRRDDPAQVFAGTAGGGIWKSVNGGTSWSQVNDFFPNLAITALAVHPTDANRMYAGTGEGFGNGGAIRGAGILRSTDGGASWTQIASTATSDFF